MSMTTYPVQGRAIGPGTAWKGATSGEAAQRLSDWASTDGAPDVSAFDGFAVAQGDTFLVLGEAETIDGTAWRPIDCGDGIRRYLFNGIVAVDALAEQVAQLAAANNDSASSTSVLWLISILGFIIGMQKAGG